MRASNFSLALVGLVASAVALPVRVAFADPAMSAPNTINNATIDPAPATGIYDLEDQFRDNLGFPLPGWEHLTRPPS